MKAIRQLYSAVLMVALLSATVATSVYAAPPDFANTTLKLAQNAQPAADRKAEHKARFQKKMQELGITQQQQDQMKALRQNFYNQNKTALDSLKSDFQQLRTLKQSGNANPEQVKALKAQIKTKREALKPQRQALHSQMSAILTPEQQAKVEAWKKEKKGKCHKKAM